MPQDSPKMKETWRENETGVEYRLGLCGDRVYYHSGDLNYRQMDRDEFLRKFEFVSGALDV